MSTPLALGSNYISVMQYVYDSRYANLQKWLEKKIILARREWLSQHQLKPKIRIDLKFYTMQKLKLQRYIMFNSREVSFDEQTSFTLMVQNNMPMHKILYRCKIC